MEIPILLTHNLEALIVLFPDGMTPPRADEYKNLHAFATVRRYEESFEEITDEEVMLLLDLTKEVLNWAHAKIIKTSI